MKADPLLTLCSIQPWKHKNMKIIILKTRLPGRFAHVFDFNFLTVALSTSIILPWTHVLCHNKSWPDRFSRFDNFFKTNKQANIYIDYRCSTKV